VSIGKVLGRVGIVLAAAVTVAIGKTPASVKIGNQTWTKQNLGVCKVKVFLNSFSDEAYGFITCGG
jgi:hypothetical protein